MKNKLIVSLIAIAAIVASCKNQQSNSETRDTVMNADSSANAMGDKSSNMADTSIMAAMNMMMENMHKMTKTGNADYDLAATLQEHHKGGVGMAEAELQNGSDDELKKMAQAIVETQGMEIKKLDTLMAQYKNAAKNYDPTNMDNGLGKAMSDDMMAMMNMPKEDTASVDQQFAIMMGIHHLGAVKMGNTIVTFAKNPMFKSMAKKMIVDQTKEIKALQNWQSSHK